MPAWMTIAEQVIVEIIKLYGEYEANQQMDDAAAKAKLDQILASARAPDFKAEDAKVDAALADPPK